MHFYLLGVHMEEKVILVMYDSPEALASFYGAIKIGAVPCRLITRIRAMISGTLNDSRARTIIVHEDFADEVDGWREKLRYLENTIVLGQKNKIYQTGFHDIVDRCSDQLDAFLHNL